MGKRSQTIGKVGETIAHHTLAQMGVEQIERIFGNWKIITFVNPARGIAHVAPGRRLSGDFRGIIPGGRSVLVEVKLRDADRLLWSDLKPHQRAALSEHARMGGLSLVIWIAADGAFIDADRDVVVLEWPIAGFAARKPITRKRARLVDMKSKRFES